MMRDWETHIEVYISRMVKALYVERLVIVAMYIEGGGFREPHIQKELLFQTFPYILCCLQ